MQKEDQNMSALQKYYRKPKLFFKLPSQLHFYNDDQIDEEEELSSLKEVGVMPMTTLNELEMKNPEALINGTAIEHLIRDCTTLKNINPKKLIKSDVDALLVGIKMASIDDHTHNFTVTCNNEECSHEFVYPRNLDKVLNSIEPLDDDYTLEIEQGENAKLIIHLRPSLYEEHIEVDNQHFNERKKLREIEKKVENIEVEENEETFEDQKIQFYGMITQIFTDMSNDAINTHAKNIVKVHIKDDSEGIDEVVEDYDEILAWLRDLDSDHYFKIRDKISEINSKGLDDVETIQCPECEHSWDQHFDINLTDFFGSGF